MVITHQTQARPALKGGAIGGLIAGAVLLLYMVLVSAAQGRDVWQSLKGAGLPFLDERATLPGFDAAAILVGLVCHFAVSAAWGALFGVLFFGLSRTATVWMGLVWGLVVWIGMYYIVLPIVGLGHLAAAVPIGPAIFEHLVFGLAVAIGFLPYQRRVLRRRPRRIGPAIPH
jgi:hypothetical protein